MMLGTTFQWWRAFLYLGLLGTFRGYIADYVAPWVDKTNDLIGAKIKPEDAAIFFCIPVLMGVFLKADEILANLVTGLLRWLGLTLFVLAWSLTTILAMAQANPTSSCLWEMEPGGAARCGYAVDFARSGLSRRQNSD